MSTFQRDDGIEAGGWRRSPLYMCKDRLGKKLLFKQGKVFLKNGIAPEELRVLFNSIVMMHGQAQRDRLQLFYAVLGDDIVYLDYAERLEAFSEARKRISKLQRRESTKQFSAELLELHGAIGLHSNLIFIGTPKLADQFRLAYPQYMQERKALRIVKTINDANAIFSYLSKERSVQADRSLQTSGIALAQRHPPIKMEQAGDRVRLSDALKEEAISRKIIRPFTATQWDRKSLVGVYSHEQKRALTISRKPLHEFAADNESTKAQQVPIPEPKEANDYAVNLMGQLCLFSDYLKPVSTLRDYTGGIMPEVVANDVEQLRKRAGLTQKQLGTIAGISQPTYANVIARRFPLSQWAANRLHETLLTTRRLAA